MKGKKKGGGEKRSKTVKGSIMSEDEKKWMIIGGVSVLVACGLGYLSRQTAKTAIRLEEALRVNVTEANPVEDTYVCVRGKVEPVGQSLVGPYSGEQCVAYKTYVKTRWQEREAKVTNVKGKRSVSWGAWKAMAESINEPVTSSVPFLVVHTEQGRQVILNYSGDNSQKKNKGNACVAS